MSIYCRLCRSELRKINTQRNTTFCINCATEFTGERIFKITEDGDRREIFVKQKKAAVGGR